MLSVLSDHQYVKFNSQHHNPVVCKQEQAQSHGATSKALAEAQHAQQHSQHAQQELSNLKLEHEALQREVAVTSGRLSAFDESCQRSLERVQTLAAALQQAQQAKVSACRIA